MPIEDARDIQQSRFPRLLSRSAAGLRIELGSSSSDGR